MGCLRRHGKSGGSQECPSCEACKELIEHALFECPSYDPQRLNFLTIWRRSFLEILSKPFLVVAFLLKVHFG